MPLRYLTFEQIVELSHEGIWVLDEDGRVTYANPRAAEILGAADRRSLLGESIASFVLPERRHLLDDQMDQLRRGESRRVETPLRRLDGHSIWCQLSVRPLTTPEGKFAGIFGFLSDQTERREAIAALERSEARYRLISEHTPDVIWTLDLATRRFTYMSPSIERLRGYSVEEARRIPIEDSLTPESWATVQALLSPENVRAQRPGQVVVTDLDQPRRDGSIVPTEVVASVIFDTGGNPQEIIGISRDITARRKAEAALRESERLLRESQHIAQIGSYVYDIPNDSWSSSEALDEIFGVGPGFSRTWTGWSAILHPEDRDATGAHLQRCITAHERFERQYRIVRQSDGAVRWVQGLGEVTVDAHGGPMQLLGTIQDITEAREQHEARRQLEARLVQGQKLESLGVLAGGVAHEFNNLLTSILGNADLVLHDLPPDSPLCDNMRAIETASRRAAEISHQMLAYSGRGRFVVERADLSRVVRDMARMLELPMPKGSTLRFELAENLPLVEADLAQLRQVVLNLVSNAAEALDPRAGGKVVVRTGLQSCDESAPQLDYFNEPVPRGRYLFVEVSDTGSGMDAGTLSKIFDPFFSTRFTGRGLGLPAALGVVRGHRGFIQVRSRVGEGTSVRLLLPPVATRAAGDGASPGASPDLADRPLVLVVDDEDAVRVLTLRLIERCGCRAMGAADGIEALDILKSRHTEFACVLLDLTMPRLGGEETLRELRVFAPRLPVLVSSGYEGSEVSRRLAALGVAGFIQKPYQLSDLKAKVTTVLKAERT
jgi:two-component system, cell cycle sensor histidine kinase and response regulator CckA